MTLSRPAIAPLPGVAARNAAITAIDAVMRLKQPLDEALERSLSRTSPALEPRDRAFARLLTVTVLRRHGELRRAVTAFLEKQPPTDSGRLWPILLAGAAQLLCLATPPHAAISSSVDLARLDQTTRRFDKLINAVLRRVSERGPALLEIADAAVSNIPAWLMTRWRAAYGDAVARDIAVASLTEPALDLSVKSDAAAWAATLGGAVLPTGSVRLANGGRIEALAGYSDGAWWVQDAAAALPAKLLGDVAGLAIADLCAAPGGKTAELAAAGARVTAVDHSERRLRRLSENLARLKLDVEIITADVTGWAPGRQFDAVLVDAPCSATGTIRRHPDLLHTKADDDIPRLAELQRRLLAAAAALVRPGGQLVYATCSLEPEEGCDQIAAFLDLNPDYRRVPIQPGEAGISAGWLTGTGDLRTLPQHAIDGFFAARLVRHS